MDQDTMRFASTRRELWWRERGITRFVAGVFEGGGAKGILYRGALEAMVEDASPAYWFTAVAGASAGAITATLVAAGLEPCQVGEEAEKALGTLRKPSLLSGLLRVRDGASYLDQDSLGDWVSEVLERQIHSLCGEHGGATVTFEELRRLTGIELDVVAVDLNRQRPIVFNYELTPRIQVTAAVVASAAIPLAFEWMPLRLKDPPLGIIVDGGVMFNYPAFVFKEPSFREWAKLPPHPPEVPVIGFLLDEEGTVERSRSDLYSEAAFLPPFSQWQSLVSGIHSSGDGQLPDDFEPKRRKFRPQRAESRKLAWLVRPLRLALWPVWKVVLDWTPAFLRWNSGGVRGNWPKPRDPVIRSLVGWFDAVMAGTRPLGVFVGGSLAVTLCLGVGAYWVAWRPLAGHVGGIVAGNVSILGAVIGLVFWVLWSMVPVYAWMTIMMVFLVGWLLHRTLQMTGYGLVKTFLQGPGAPIWVGADSNDRVVRLPVPPEITTLGFTNDGNKIALALERAREATRTELRRLAFPITHTVVEVPIELVPVVRKLIDSGGGFHGG
jgi:predicted acylesterase/phospholipase RssA